MQHLKARRPSRTATLLPGSRTTRRPRRRYEEALAERTRTWPQTYFFLGNSYDKLYKPAKKGEPENDAYIQKAIDELPEGRASTITDPKMKKLALEYLVAAYGPDKLNDPAKAEPVVQKMIQMEPNEPTNYFALAKIYEDAGRYDEAEADAASRRRRPKPNDPAVYTTSGRLLQPPGRLREDDRGAQTSAPNSSPNNPRGLPPHRHLLLGQELARTTGSLPPSRRSTSRRGSRCEDKALEPESDYMDALIYKNILLRHGGATWRRTRTKQRQLLKEADELRNKAIELQKKTGAS